MNDTIRASFDGQPIAAPEGVSVAAALVSSGCDAWRRTKSERPRGLFCGIGVCYDCIVEIDGETAQRACMVPLREGMEIVPAVGSSAAAANDLEVE